MNVENIPFLQIHLGKNFRQNRIRRGIKSIVFDLDETIGSFSDLHILWTGLNNIQNFSHENDQNIFNAIFDLYPEFLRYGILSIFDYLITKKKQGAYDKMYLYTNNNCPPPWISFLCNYIQSNLKNTNPNGELFDKIISAFKINKKIIEMSRTTLLKTHSDFIRCSLLPATTEICFIDDSYHTNMLNDHVYYIQPAAYHHGLTRDTIIDRFIHSKLGSLYSTIFLQSSQNNKDGLSRFLKDWFGDDDQNATIRKNIEVDILIAQKIMYHIKEFLFCGRRQNKTQKKTPYHISYRYKTKTRKRNIK